LDGKILTDGAAKIYVEGLVAAADAAVGHRPAGTQYGYHIEAMFSEDSGSASKAAPAQLLSTRSVRQRQLATQGIYFLI